MYNTDASFQMPSLPPTMSLLGLSSHGHVERLFAHSSASMDNSETQGLEDLHGGIGATHDS